ncbi:hypothetical protein ACIGFK_27440 [Streptomyces sp. NPDC085524]|uniref:hypothetical protein n=1 Tax=unclassified Streptomyces TaxID=2593676 RepID=UPI0035D6C223
MSHTSRTSWIARNKVLTSSGVVIALMTLGACTDTDTAGKDDAAAKKPAASSPAAGGGDSAQKKAAFKGNGTFEVGKDIQPGTYRTTGNGSAGCYWERAKDSSGEADSIISNDNVTGASYVTIADSDKIFKTNDCKDWEAVDPKAAGGSPKTEFSGKAGMLKVGTDVAPGTYKSAGPAEDGAGCYWERSKSAAHDLDSIIANENPTGSAVVTIGADDAYFKTNDCADWKKS